MSQIQYDMFENRSVDVYELKLEVKADHESLNNIRKGIFARHGEICKKLIEAFEIIDELKERISKLEKDIYG